MNCKPGDIARIVNSMFGNNDKLVRVIGPSPLNDMPVGSKAYVHGNIFRRESDGRFAWVIEALGSPISKGSGRVYQVCPCADDHLRPIRDPGDDATDETLLWKPVPQEVTQ